MAGVPDAVKALAELSPVEDLILASLRQDLPTMNVQSLIEIDQTFPLILVRRKASFGDGRHDARFTDSAAVAIYIFVSDPNGDEDAAILSEVVRVLLRNAWLNHRVIPGRGHFTHIELSAPAHRVTDWATASGPVQYADLPSGVSRYESGYLVEFRKPSTTPYPLTP